jgi:uncharacterized protein with FMN-binding domain
MKKVLISIGVVVIFAAYALYQHLHGSSSIAPTPAVVPTETNQTPVSQNPPPATSTTGNAPGQTGSTPTPTPVAQGQYKDGAYTGNVANAFYGNLQVVAVIQNGKLADVQFPVYPSDQSHSKQISQQALPQLKSEAIASQSANVDIVSGATQDSQAFQQSLQSALDQAKS